jgi:hypothetical protein
MGITVISHENDKKEQEPRSRAGTRHAFTGPSAKPRSDEESQFAEARGREKIAAHPKGDLVIYLRRKRSSSR